MLAAAPSGNQSPFAKFTASPQLKPRISKKNQIIDRI